MLRVQLCLALLGLFGHAASGSSYYRQVGMDMIQTSLGVYSGPWLFLLIAQALRIVQSEALCQCTYPGRAEMREVGWDGALIGWR
jgi:hypothetical protein